ncbi:MAG: hypothetical protein WB822_08010 [Rhodoplanes sp.]
MKIPSGSSFAAGMPFCLAGALLFSHALATDLDALVRLLVPAYMAQNFAAVCTVQDPQFLSELKGGPAAINTFAKGIKKRVTADLAADEAEKVRVTAADTARQVARHELQLLNQQPAGGPPVSIKTWCDRSAKPFIIEALRRHAEKKQEFEKELEDAKR